MSRILVNFTAVSYTHLDVYKRQLQNMLKQFPDNDLLINSKKYLLKQPINNFANT